MKFVFNFVILLACLAGLAGRLGAQQKNVRDPAPRVGYVYPAGAKAGTKIQVVVGGQYLENCDKAHFFGTGVSARIVGYEHPLTQKEYQEMKERLEALQEKRKTEGLKSFTKEELAEGQLMRSKLGYRMNRQQAPAISEAVTLELTIAPDAPQGPRELRLHTPNGSSNPLQFHVGVLTEYSQPTAATNTAPPPGKEGDARSTRKLEPLEVTLPAVVNGQVLAGETHRLRFHATKDLSLVVRVQARALIPYLADAVPGWFQATVALSDAKGREVAYADDFRFDPDPVLHFVIPADGDYTVTLKDSLFRGRQDFVYRVSLGELPFVTGVYPLGAPATEQATVEVRGWNLPTQKAVVRSSDGRAGLLKVALRKDGVVSNEVTFAMDRQPEVAETPGEAGASQAVTVPCIINGRIGRPGERDQYAFEGKAGDKLVAEIVARRLNSPVDTALELKGPDGARVAFNDDHEDKGDGLSTHHADSRILATLPADGRYRIYVSDTQGQGGPEFAYRLHLRRPQPDFELRVVPSSLSLRPGSQTPVTVHVLRKDGFDGEIQLGIRDDSRSFGLSGARVPAGQDKVCFTISTPQQVMSGTRELSVIGRATGLGPEFVRTAMPAEDMMQAFAYRHLVNAEQLCVEVLSREKTQRATVRLTNDLPLRLPAGGKVRLRVQGPPEKFVSNVQLELIEPPDGITLKEESEDSDEQYVEVDATKAKPGQKGNLLLMASGERSNAGAKEKKKKGGNRLPIGYLPAVPYEVVAPAK